MTWGVTLSWFESYLTNKTQQTIVNDTVSDRIEVTHRVPQGSVLGPLLFLIYINDLNEAISHSIIHHFADDTNILFSHKSLEKINKVYQSWSLSDRPMVKSKQNFIECN